MDCIKSWFASSVYAVIVCSSPGPATALHGEHRSFRGEEYQLVYAKTPFFKVPKKVYRGFRFSLAPKGARSRRRKKGEKKKNTNAIECHILPVKGKKKVKE